MSLHIPDIGSDDDNLAAALAYTTAGWYILPVRMDTKHPGSVVGKGWPAMSSSDPKQITAWFAGTDHGIALHAGRSGAVILDVDDPDNVPDEVLLVMESDAPYQSTRTDQPGRGHYLLANTTGRRIGNSLGKLATDKKWGEVRGANGVIVVAPTVHPDGGLYRWQRTGAVPELPDYIAAALPDSTTPEDTATDAQVKAFLDANANGTLTEGISGLANTLRAKIDRGASCHMSTLGVVTDAMAEAAAGLYPARDALNAIWPIYRTTVTTGTSTGRKLTKREAATSYKGIVAWAIGQAEAGAAKARERVEAKYPTPVIDTTPPPTGHLEQLEQDFWTARPNHQLIYQAALSRMASPWAVMACCTARIICRIPPAVTLPPVVGGVGSLNWFAAITAKSGGGKGAAMAVANALIGTDDDLRIRGIGSGEGMIETYERNRKPDDERPPVISVLFMVDEIDSLGAMGGRSGQTTMSILRQGFSGETLGFSYRGRQGETVAAHTYRMALIASVQPRRAGVLLDDAAGGTPQRFMWFPGRDKRITATPPTWPTTPKGADRVIPMMSDRDMAAAIGSIPIPPEAAQAIREHRAKSMCEDGDDLDGHILFVREKFAYALAVMDARTEINSEDWRLSGIAADVSSWCRGKAKQGYARGQEDTARERGHQRGIERDQQDVSSQIAFEHHINRIVDKVLRQLKDNGPMTRGAINRAITSSDRPRLNAALNAAREHELIKEVDGRWTTT